MSRIITEPFILGIPHEHRFLCFPIKRESPHKTLPIFQTCEMRTVLPIFNTERECVRFRNEVMSQYHTHLSDWEFFPVPENDYKLPKRCISVYVENVLHPSTPKSITFQSQPVSFDFNDENLIAYMSLQAHMGFMVVRSFGVENHILSLNGLFVDSSYEHVQPEQHLHYLCENLENLI